MKHNIIILYFINLFFISCNGQDSKINNAASLPDWKTNTYDYAKQIIPKKIESSGDHHKLTTINLKKTYLTKVDNDTIVLAICSLETIDKTKSALTYYFISPKTNKRISEFQSVMTVKGCDYDIPAFVIKDITNDGKDDFIFLELYNEQCNGDYWIKSNFHQINPTTTKNELDFYTKLRNDMKINRKIEKAEKDLLQKRLEVAVLEIFKSE